MIMPFSASRTSFYLDVVKGERKGFAAAAVRAGLAVPAYLLYLPLSTAARCIKLYAKRPYRAPCPVISVGNLTAGGTGKTPMVEWVVNWLKAGERRPAVLARGYRAVSGSSDNDETQLLAGRLEDVPVITGANRSESARRALRKKTADCFVLDDGFQHYAMARDLDIVLIDCLFPFGGGHLLPRGLLREPVGALSRADVIVLTRSDQATPEAKQQIRDRISRVDASLPFVEAVHKPLALADTNGCTRALDSIAGAKVLLFSAIGNPEGFEKTVESLGASAANCYRFRDHHRFSDGELETLASEAESSKCDAVLATEKDMVKIGGRWKSSVPLLALQVRLEITSGAEILERLLCSAILTSVL